MIYYANILILFLVDIIFPKTERKNKIIFCVTATLLWVLISGLRSTSIGADTETYRLMFNEVLGTSWKEVIGNFRYYLASEGAKDPGYTLLVKIIQIFTQNYQVYLVVVACVIFIPMGVWIYRYSEDPFISYLIFSALFYSFLAITGIRQSIAMSLVVFIGYGLVKKKKYIRFIILVLIASAIHRGVLIALLYLPLSRLVKSRANIVYMVLAIGLALILFVLRDSYTTLMAGILNFERYAIQQEGATPYTFTLIYISLLIVTILCHQRTMEKHPSSVMYVGAMFIGLICLPMVYVNQSAMRGVQMFSIYMMLLIPQILDTIFTKRDQVLVKMILAAVILVLLYTNNPTYAFFWAV